jgi:hypothetical protein
LAGAATLLVALGVAGAAAAQDPQDLVPLVQGHYDAAADRINLIFAGYQIGDEQALRDTATDMLGWDGNVVFDDAAGNETENPEAPYRQLGVFGIEPWRSSKDKFNIRYTLLEPGSEYDWQVDSHVPASLQAVPDATIVVLGGLEIRRGGAISAYADVAPG